MSLYFDCFIACTLRSDVPAEVVAVLQFMTGMTAERPLVIPEHTFFTTEGWEQFLDPAAFPAWTARAGPAWSRFVPEPLERGPTPCWNISLCRWLHDDIECYVLLWEFLCWLAPYAAEAGYIGFLREQYSLHPQLLYMKHGSPYWSQPTEPPVGHHTPPWDG